MKPKHLFNIIKRNNYTFDYDCPYHRRDERAFL